MTDYIIKSSVCLLVALAVYHLFLEKEKMHKFNRVYLLFSLVFGLVIPQLTLPAGSALPMSIPLDQIAESPVTYIAALPAQTAPLETGLNIVLIVYMLGAAVMLTRFLWNIISLTGRIKRSEVLSSEGQRIVLLKEQIVPHSFLNYIFLNEDAYRHGICPQIIAHEFSHVKQKHSLDIIFVELLKVVFWFNPLFILYKRAIQLNHEFLADESVISSYGNVVEYQQTLLETAGLQTVVLANNLNYSLTKKRLKMMKKQTSRGTSLFKELALIPMFALLVVIFSDAGAQPLNQQQGTVMSKDDFYKGSKINWYIKNKFVGGKGYETLTATEKNQLPSPVTPSQATFSKWKSYDEYPLLIDGKIAPSTGGPEQVRVFIDGKNILTQSLDKHKPGDFASYSETKQITGQFTMITVNLYTPKYIQSFGAGSKYVTVLGDQALVGSPNPPYFVPERYKN